ncbi:MAG: bifunctional glutamate--cysteine ligase GshA/glutathione synthetase GshB [Spirochaetales bacterium]|nr:bifunctional glutamate--cysteine ligase GshA/glutathione synthetase GshB [Spirochaetales bacterium]
MENVINAIKQLKLGNDLIKGSWGIEKENLRVDEKGNLALTKHPLKLGDKLTHPYITTDFSESQVEVITPPSKSIDEAYNLLENLHDIVVENLPENEYLWPSSMPAIIPDDSLIPIADYGSGEEALKKMKYREYIAEKYGKHKQLICGIHYNFSFDNDFIHTLHSYCASNDSCYNFKNSIYLTISRNLLKYQWLLTYLLGANVATHSSYRHCCELERHKKEEEFIFKGACSYRNSLCGYRNKKDFRVSFDTLEENLKDLKQLISSGYLSGVNEYYSPVRLKNSKDNNSIVALERDGIEYIELRMIDLNPLTKTGINKDDLTLVHLIILSSLLYPCSSYKEDEQVEAILKQNEVSFNGHNLSNELRDEGIIFFTRLQNVLQDLDVINDDYNRIIKSAMAKLKGEEKLYSQIIYEKVKSHGYINHHLEVTKKWKIETLNNSFSFKGYQDLELSTQILLKEALQKGLKIEVLDRYENFISLKKGDHKEFIKQATKTSLDSYATALIMENKAITKKVLLEGNISVPKGDIYTDIKNALIDYNKYKDRKIVIKPNNTNFGIGITILNPNFSVDNFKQGLDLAFKNDRTVLIEHFHTGNEYRFTVINGEVAGVLQRVPANIKGDGISTIEELVKIKNSDPLRNKGYRTPLEFLRLDEEELFILKNLNLTPKSILKKDEIVYLRENSNISTGGDSIDFTDDVDESYKIEAINGAKAVGANITGVDMIIENIKAPRTKDNATIIELNFNPAIHIHCYPYRGKNRRLGRKVLTALGF